MPVAFSHKGCRNRTAVGISHRGDRDCLSTQTTNPKALLTRAICCGSHDTRMWQPPAITKLSKGFKHPVTVPEVLRGPHLMKLVAADVIAWGNQVGGRKMCPLFKLV
eukprot:6436381-Amphidinium_carterae.2